MNAFAGPERGEFVVPFQEAIDFYRQKIALPTQGWRDIDGRSHDRAAVIAGATKEALLADLIREIDKGIAGKTTPEQFRASFEEIVGRLGWTGWKGEGTAKGRAWRARVIYETNLSTAYAAGRYKQMTDPDIVKVYKWWRYRHAYYRVPKDPREQHVAWDGLILAWDDPFWNTHYPPNDWFCSCGVETLMDADLEAEGLTPGVAPDLGERDVRDPKTGEIARVPNGIGFGWDHAPGQNWARGLVPPELSRPLEPLLDESRSPLMPAGKLPSPRRFSSAELPRGEEPAFYAERFLQEFGAGIGAPALFRDAAGHAIVISDDLFRDRSGAWKTMKRGRELQMLRLAETIKDPDEIWLAWWLSEDQAEPLLLRSYLRRDAKTNGFALFAWSARGWKGETVFSADSEQYLLGQRRGALLWRRKE